MLLGWGGRVFKSTFWLQGWDVQVPLVLSERS